MSGSEMFPMVLFAMFFPAMIGAFIAIFKGVPLEHVLIIVVTYQLTVFAIGYGMSLS